MDLKEPSIHIDLQLAVLSCEFLYPEGKLKKANSTKDCLMLHAKWWMEKFIVGLKDWKMGTFVRVAAGNFQCSTLKLQVFHVYLYLGGGFKYVLFSSLYGEMINFDEHIFQMVLNHQPVIESVNCQQWVYHPFLTDKRHDIPMKIVRELTIQKWCLYPGSQRPLNK